VKIDVNKIPSEGLVLEENIPASELDLETDIFKFRGPLHVRAKVSKITNAVTAELNLDAVMYAECGRCLNSFDIAVEKDLKFNYHVDKSQQFIDFNPDIREEIIMGYPINPLCNPDCKGLCPKCGKNLNEGGCSCAIT